MDPECPFCQRITDGALLARSEHSVAFEDQYPVSPGHVLVVPRRHVSGVFDLDRDEQLDLWGLLAGVQAGLHRRAAPDGFNVGINVGRAAGQTVEHAHVHLIPRYHGDVEDPRGGVRRVIPAKAAWWDEP